MVPIFEQGNGRGIGHDLQSFADRFREICQRHVADNRALAFAFVFYDFNDRDTRKILADEGVFAKLDRLSGQKLSIFYLHAGTRHAIERFNSVFLRRLGLEQEVALPCVVFFRLSKGEFIDLKSVELSSESIVHSFQELYLAIQEYVADLGEGTAAKRSFLRETLSKVKSMPYDVLVAMIADAIEQII